VEKDEQIPTRVPLPEPRPLTAKERALIEFLLASPIARELRLQVETVEVDAVCSYGCPSAWPMESRPVIGSVDRVDSPWVLAEVDGGERLDLAVEHDREVLERVVRVSDKMRLVW
jgi:hypothetical protein